MDRYILRSAFFPGDTNANLVQVVNHDFGQFVVAGSKDLSADANPSVVADLVASTKKLARLGYLVRVHSNDPSAADYRLTAKGEKKARRD